MTLQNLFKFSRMINPKLLLGYLTIQLALVCCRKEKYEPQSSGGTYEYAYTLRRFSLNDTLAKSQNINERYKITETQTNEFRNGYMFSIFINDQLISNILLTRVVDASDYSDVNSDYSLLKSTHFSPAGIGIIFEGYRGNFRNGESGPQILDFPFPGWNRFLKTDE